MVGCCEQGNELSCSIKGTEFHDELSAISFSRALLHGVRYRNTSSVSRQNPSINTFTFQIKPFLIGIII
jgi:hypothetical protein